MLADRVVLVTGGSSGIGLAAAHGFARVGARVVIAARDAARGEVAVQAITAESGNAHFIRADVSCSEEVQRLVQGVVAKYGRLDAAFNNAATVSGAFAATADFTEAQFDDAMSLNLKSVWLCMKYEIEQMLRQTPAGGVIVNTSSVNGLGGAPGAALYSAAKAGVLALTKSAAQEYGSRGIRVNALAAGFFRTPMLEEVMIKASHGGADGAAALRAHFEQLVPLKRIGAPKEAADAAIWLCSDAASYVNGHSMIVDGGLTSGMR